MPRQNKITRQQKEHSFAPPRSLFYTGRGMKQYYAPFLMVWQRLANSHAEIIRINKEKEN